MEFLNLTAIFASNAHIRPKDLEHPTSYVIGDPTEGALLVLAGKAGIDVEVVLNDHPELREHSFDSIRKRMSSTRLFEGNHYSFVKGAPESVLEVCSHIIVSGKRLKLNSKTKGQIMQDANLRAESAMRNLALAYKEMKPVKNWQNVKTEEMESDLTYLGFVSILDPPREEVRDALEAAKTAHVPVNIITGDSALTARAIALKIGLAETAEDIKIVTGEELRHMPNGEVLGLITRGSTVFSRVSPEDKLRIVSLGQDAGYVVAVTGDGINDAPALKKADIGVAMGLTGTDVAKQSAEIVLLDDSFNTLITAVKSGRVIFRDIKKPPSRA